MYILAAVCDHKNHSQNEAESVDSRAEKQKGTADDIFEPLGRVTLGSTLPLCLFFEPAHFLFMSLSPGPSLAQSTLPIHED